MVVLNKILFLVLGLVLLLFLQSSGFLAIKGINPNLLLIGLLMTISPPHRFLESDSRLLAISIGIMLSLAWFWFNFWFQPFLFLAILLFIFFFLRNFLTGDVFFDFLIGVAGLTSVFYFLDKISHWSLPSLLSVVLELIYNLALGAILWLIINKLLGRRAV